MEEEEDEEEEEIEEIEEEKEKEEEEETSIKSIETTNFWFSDKITSMTSKKCPENVIKLIPEV